MMVTPAEAVRCFWCDGSEILNDYHDKEWGYPVTDEYRLFEKISLEGFQSGLSWLTILKKREGFREAFAGFDFHKVAHYTERDVERLLQNENIVRHPGKIEATINNAKRAVALQKEIGSLAVYFWRFEVDVSARPERVTADFLKTLTRCPESIALSKDLKKRGWKFVGPTTMYAFMQAMGLVNDHQHNCHVYQTVKKSRLALVSTG